MKGKEKIIKVDGSVTDVTSNRFDTHTQPGEMGMVEEENREQRLTSSADKI